MTPRELIRFTASSFRKAGIQDAENDASLLLSHLTGIAPLDLRLDSDTLLDPVILSEYRFLADQRRNHVPLQYLLGEAPFYTRLFKVDHRVLIPRPETELLCEWALEVLTDYVHPRVLDLCCGSGVIGLTLKAERPDALVTLSDISRDALNVAALNAALFSLDVEFSELDLLQGYNQSSFDVIVSNPPYIPTDECDHLQPEVLHEPRIALDGGADGCTVYRRIIESARTVLEPGGKLLMELGIHESDLVADCMANHGYTEIQIRKDYAGIDRMILAVSP